MIHRNFEDFLYSAKNDLRISLILILIISALFLCIRRRKLKLPPGPTGLPFLGYFPFLGEDPHLTLARLGKTYGGIFSLYVGQKYVVVINEWTALKEAFDNRATASRPPKLFDLLPDGFGFENVNGAEWIQQRRFSMKAMKEVGLGKNRWEHLAQEEVNELSKLIKKHGSKPLDVCRFFSSTFASNMMTLMFGRHYPIGDPTTEFVSKCVDSVMNSFPSFSFGYFLPWVKNIAIKLRIMEVAPAEKDLLAFSDFVSKLIKQRMKALSSNDNKSFLDAYAEEIERFADVKENNWFTENYMKGNAQILVIGGSETTRTSMIWLLLAIAENQDVQRKVQQELDQVLGKNGIIKWADRFKVPYTYATIMESMRWKTVVPINSLRMSSEDIKVGGYDIPKNAIIAVNNWLLHNDDKFWPEPEKFNPERFLLEDGKRINFKPDSYVPFSYGRRNCPGEMIALMEILIYFTTLMQMFRISPKEGTKVSFNTILGLTYQPKNVELRFSSRV